MIRKALIGLATWLLAMHSLFGQLQMTNSSIIIGWDYDIETLSTNMSFSIVSLNNNTRTLIKKFNFDGNKTTEVSNGFKFVKTQISLVPGTNNLVVFAELNSRKSFDSNVLELPDVARVSVIRIGEIK